MSAAGAVVGVVFVADPAAAEADTSALLLVLLSSAVVAAMGGVGASGTVAGATAAESSSVSVRGNAVNAKVAYGGAASGSPGELAPSRVENSPTPGAGRNTTLDTLGYGRVYGFGMYGLVGFRIAGSGLCRVLGSGFRGQGIWDKE
jgi:hypothetical protein